jgi:transcriptional regulator with XRE-family HTH domain
VFYDRFADLCKEKGISVSRGAQEAGISKSLVTKWKTNGVEVPSAEVLSKLSRYFGLSISELLGEHWEQPAPSESAEELKMALFRGQEEVTDAMLEEVLSFAEYVARREASRKKTP